MTSQEMMRSKLKLNHVWVNVAAVDQEPNWQEQPKPIDWNNGNPNDPIYSPKLFGYDQAKFMAKQYK